MLLSKDAILSADDLRTETVEVPEWGGKVKIRCMTGLERDQFESYVFQETQGGKNLAGNIRARLVALTIVGEDNKRIFSDKDVAALGNKNAEALDRIFNVARRLSGLSQDDLGAAVKNSESTLPGALPLD